MTIGIFIIVSANHSANNFKKNYCFQKLMSNKEMLTKENTLQLPPQFPSISSDESESENEYSSFGERRKHYEENEIRLKKIKSLNGKFWSFSFFEN